MPRTFWNHVIAACALGFLAALLTAGRKSYEDNALYPVFSAPGFSLSLPAILLFCIFISVIALLCMRIAGAIRPLNFIALYAAALFIPFLFLATRFWTDLLALLLFAISIRYLLEARGFRSMLPPLIVLLAAIIVRGQLAPGAAALCLYLLVSRGIKTALLFAALFSISYAGALLLDLGTAGRIAALLRPPSGFGEFYSVESMLALFRTSVEVQLLLAFTPFVLVSFIGLTVRETGQDRAALLLILALYLISLALFPAATSDPETARLQFMLLSLCTIVGANSGVSLLQEAAYGRRALLWSIIVGGLFLMPALISFV
jgi:hypothetical protein